jgi:hypothetical protein
LNYRIHCLPKRATGNMTIGGTQEIQNMVRFGFKENSTIPKDWYSLVRTRSNLGA